MSKPRFTIMATAAVAATLFLAACGSDSSAKTTTPVDGSTTVVDVTMTDMAFTPTVIDVKAGDTVKFRFRNDGKAVHEAVIGDEAFQMDHAKEMSSMGGSGDAMPHGSDDEEAPLVVKPGETGELTYTATAAGSLLIACHQPGHWEAGMKATINVG